jgi:hypothetical protein
MLVWVHCIRAMPSRKWRRHMRRGQTTESLRFVLLAAQRALASHWRGTARAQCTRRQVRRHCPPPNASSTGLLARHAAKRDTAASTLIQAIVTVCTRLIRRMASGEAICGIEAIHDIMGTVVTCFAVKDLPHMPCSANRSPSSSATGAAPAGTSRVPPRAPYSS